MDSAGTPHFLEANLMPNLFSGYGSFPKACVLNMGLDYESMVLRIAGLGLARSTDMIDEEFERNRLIVPALEPAFETVGLTAS
jgi:D-alanine-D-alanine ligase